jgi:hypothetical protein
MKKDTILIEFEELVEKIEDGAIKSEFIDFQDKLEMHLKAWSVSASKRLLLQWKAAEILEQAIRDSKSRAREVKKLRDSVKPILKLLKS